MTDNLAMRLSLAPSHGFLYWKDHPSEKFTIKSGYARLMDESEMEENGIA